jgi:hypothetical protein
MMQRSSHPKSCQLKHWEKEQGGTDESQVGEHMEEVDDCETFAFGAFFLK